MTDVDVERVEQQLQLIRDRVVGGRQASRPPGDPDAGRLIDDATRVSRVSAHWGIVPSWPVAGRLEVLGKRVIRIMLRWYINPIVEQQNDFNSAVLRALYEIESEVDALRAELGASPESERRPAGPSG